MSSETHRILLERSALGARALHEHNDCVVVALSVATGKPYDEIHASIEKNRLSDGTVKASVWRKLNEQFGGVRVVILPHTIGQFCRQHPKGVFTFSTLRHALALKNGAVYETMITGLRTRIADAYEFNQLNNRSEIS